jgi:hypothetical protein
MREMRSHRNVQPMLTVVHIWYLARQGLPTCSGGQEFLLGVSNGEMEDRM